MGFEFNQVFNLANEIISAAYGSPGAFGAQKPQSFIAWMFKSLQQASTENAGISSATKLSQTTAMHVSILSDLICAGVSVVALGVAGLDSL